ncbi:MAG: hypothetical protein AAF362_18975 [Pseudomonadota bacterium]
MAPPVLLLVFNRPEPTAQVFEQIRQARPERLYVAADGPRDDVVADKDKCAQVRKIATAVDWPCKVQTLFRAKNLGCLKGVSTGIDWFFSKEECGIILEDDVVPMPAFFSFCGTMLARYRDDKQVYAVSGYNLLARKYGPAGYFRSRYFKPWGWAGWADRWQEIDITLPNFEHDHATACDAGHLKWWEKRHWRNKVSRALRKQDTWDYQWQFFILSKGGQIIRPTANMITNVGFGPDATHTTSLGRYVMRLQENATLTNWTDREVRPGFLEDFRLFVFSFGGGPISFIKRSFFNKKTRVFG